MSATPAFDMVLFGATGDLAMRKLLPALFEAHCAGSLHRCGRVIALGRAPQGREQYLAQVEREARPHTRDRGEDPQWPGFLQRLEFLTLDAGSASDFESLAAALGAPQAQRATVCYLATPPRLFAPLCARLAAVGLNHPGVRVVLEKPLGHDLESSETIHAEVGRHFAENQIYRIDHYLGKESVQNLMAIRFGNVLFEPLWRREWIDHVQITIAEELGVEGRGAFYERTGALRDMLQNHLLQLLCMVAMEPPATLDADAIRDEKLKVLKALRPIGEAEVDSRTVRGQYRAGAVAGKPVPGYRQEANVHPDSRTETFVAVRADIANWRWSGVPFFLRTGKRMQEQLAEIVVQFRSVPLALFGLASSARAANRLVIRLQPEERISLHFLVKEPGDAMRVRPSSLDLDVLSTLRGRRAGAYERLLLDVVRGRLGLFMRRDEQAAAWSWVEPMLASWQREGSEPKAYTAGTWGPAASSALLSRDGASWHEES